MAQGVRLFLGFLAAAASSVALAHVGVHPEGGFEAIGLTHPFLGLDHLLAMIAMGIWTVQVVGRRLLIVPPVVVAAIGLGAWLLLAA